MPDRPTGKTKHAELTLDQIADMQPGLGGLMPDISNRFWIAYYAARGGNWALAGHELRELAKLLRQGALTRPKYEPQLTAFERTNVAALLRAIEVREFGAFADAFEKATDVANAYHRSLDHPEISWKLPPRPPEHLELGPK